MVWIVGIVCLFVGVIAGVVVMALRQAARDEQRERNEWRRIS